MTDKWTKIFGKENEYECSSIDLILFKQQAKFWTFKTKFRVRFKNGTIDYGHALFGWKTLKAAKKAMRNLNELFLLVDSNKEEISIFRLYAGSTELVTDPNLLNNHFGEST